MVFPEDSQWRERLQEAAGGFYADSARYSERYRSWGTEELLVQCVRRFMPWVRDIIILLAQESQRQPWMDGYGIRVVFHSDFMPPEHLPTYNSRAMEMYLHRIPGLSDLFLYANDDMFPLVPMEEHDFFIDGKPCQRYRETPLPDNPNLFHKACLNGLNFVARAYNRHYTTTWLKNGHSIAPILKDTCRKMWRCYGSEIDRSVTPFRDVRNFNQYIYGWRQHFAGLYFPKAARSRYLNVKNCTPDEMAEAVRDADGILCLNDHENVVNVTPYAAAVREAVERRLA